MTVPGILAQFHICEMILDASRFLSVYDDLGDVKKQIDVARLTATSKVFKKLRKSLFCDVFILRVENEIDYKSALTLGARRVHLSESNTNRWVQKNVFDFTEREKSLLYFKCESFNQPIKSFGSLKVFICYSFDRPVLSFDSLAEFVCNDFNKPIESFGGLRHFNCLFFNQPIRSFGNLETFSSLGLTLPIRSFDSLKSFECVFFETDMKKCGFGSLVRFKSALFDQHIDSFGSLRLFLCNSFNQPVISFDSLRIFRSLRFNQPITSFGHLKMFDCYDFDQPIVSFGDLQFFFTRKLSHTIRPEQPSSEENKN